MAKRGSAVAPARRSGRHQLPLLVSSLVEGARLSSVNSLQEDGAPSAFFLALGHILNG